MHLDGHVGLQHFALEVAQRRRLGRVEVLREVGRVSDVAVLPGIGSSSAQSRRTRTRVTGSVPSRSRSGSRDGASSHGSSSVFDASSTNARASIVDGRRPATAAEVRRCATSEAVGRRRPAAAR